MKDEVRDHLLALSADFYSTHAVSFDESRKHAWGTWPQLFDKVQHQGPIASVLDIGCGNGRFAGFLDHQGLAEIDYTGVDPEERFIEIARREHPGRTFIKGTIEQALALPLSYDLVVCFGLFHHLPGAGYREALMRSLSSVMNENGTAIISFWQPKLLKNFSTKVVETGSIDFETDDFLMGWNGDFSHPRYVHHFERDEIEALIAQSGLDLIALLQGSGNDVSNIYALLTS